MTTNHSSGKQPRLDGSGMRIAIACGRFNDLITDMLLAGARRALAAIEVADDDIVVEWVPGAFELPLAARALADTGAHDAVVCLGVVVRGATTHYEYVAGECAAGIQRVQLETGVPVIFGVLTTENVEQALERADPERDDKGGEVARTAVEMVALLRRLQKREA